MSNKFPRTIIQDPLTGEDIEVIIDSKGCYRNLKGQLLPNQLLNKEGKLLSTKEINDKFLSKIDPETGELRLSTTERVRFSKDPVECLRFLVKQARDKKELFLYIKELLPYHRAKIKPKDEEKENKDVKERAVEFMSDKGVFVDFSKVAYTKKKLRKGPTFNLLEDDEDKDKEDEG